MRISDWSSDVCSSDLGDARIYVNVRNNISGEVAGAKSRRMREMPVLMRNLFPLADGVVAVSGGVAADTERLMDMPAGRVTAIFRSEEHTSELQSLMRISYAGFCLKKKKKQIL